MVLAYISDHFRCRGLVSIVSGLLGVIGFAMFLGQCLCREMVLVVDYNAGSNSRHVQYGSLFFSITGAYSGAATLATWNANNATPHTRRATTIAIGFIMTNSGGILATWLLGDLSPAPKYTKATITLLIFSTLMVLFSAVNLVYLWDQNRRKRAIRAMTMSREDEEPGLGDKSAWFEYNL